MQREAFLNRVRTAVVARTRPSAARVHPDRLRLSDADVDALFDRRVEDANGIVHRPEGQESVVELIASILDFEGADEFLSWDASELPVPGLLERLAEDGYTTVDPILPSHPEDRDARLADLDRIKVGLTGADAAFAESGTVVVSSGPGRSRLASLIPVTHIAIVRRDDIHRSAYTWLAEHADSLTDATNVVFITGPSRTGDIEMHLNLGVHGPGDLHVIVI